tara:strand:+ start:242 stop:547 length:306 start_codon:yes stop_codon:yes gene_type:complete
MSVKIIFTRVDLPGVNKLRGDVIDVIDGNVFEGNEINKVGGTFSRILVEDMDISDPLITRLLDGDVHVAIPATQTAVYQALVTTGMYAGTKAEFEEYIVDA